MLFNEKLFREILTSEPEDFLLKVCKNYKRIGTNFQVVSFEDKLKQYHSTSMGILLGNALEVIIREYLVDKGAILLPEDYVRGMKCDQIFSFCGKIVLIEQKIRDDHDSTKKRGQVLNYVSKKDQINEINEEVKSTMWFIDPFFQKNQKFYREEIGDELLYGEEIELFFKEVFQDDRCKGFFKELENFVAKQRETLVSLNLVDATVDYKELTPRELLDILSDEYNKEGIAKHLFGGAIPYEGILVEALLRRKTPINQELISLLKEKIDE